MSLNSPDSYLDIHDANLRIGGDVEAQAIKLAQIEIISNATTTSTVQFNNATKSFDAASNIEVGTANLFVDTTTSKVGIGTNAPAYTLDVRGNVYALSDVDIGIGYRDNLIPKMTGRVNNVNITALNQRTRTSYATAEKAASTWTPRTIDASAWLSVAWSPELSLFVAVAFSGTNQLATSPDGITWTGRTMVTGGWTGVVWSSELSLFVAVAYSGTNQLATSPDGITWTGRTMVTGGWNRITWSPELSLFVAVEYQGNQFATSTDGINWTSGTITTGALGEWADIVWSPELSIFVTVDYSSNPGRFATSTDGTNWTTHTIGGTNWISVAWSPELSLFVAVSGNNTNNFATSPDGINWTIGTIVSGIWTDLIWSPESSLFVAVGFSSGTNHIATSPDGITWTSHTIASGDWKRILWSPELSLFVTLGTGGTNQAATSNFVIPSPLNTPMSHPGQLHVDTATGNVGIGTISPDKRLHVYTGAGEGNTQLHLQSADRYSTIQMLDDTGAILFGNDRGAMRFITGYNASLSGGSEAMRILGNGDVGIGTNSPNAKLHIRSIVNDEGDVKLRLEDNSSNLTFRLGHKAGTSGYTTGWANIDPNGGGNTGVSIWDALLVQGTLSVSGSKNFVIDHPLQPTLKKLTHVAIESPRVDLMYRGTIQLKDGKAIVNIDKECVGDESCMMMNGTFEALCRDPVYYLQNTTDFSRLIGAIDGNTLTIISEDVNSSASVNWMVVAERKDKDILESLHTTDDGRLITETNDTLERVNKNGSKRYPGI